MIGIIYKIVNIENGKIYIGQTIQKFSNRIRSHKSHLKCGVHHNKLLQRAYNKYGMDVFSFKVIEKCDDSIIDERERFWIGFYKTTDRKFGYNFENGGNENKKHHKETLEKFIISSRGKNNKLNEDDVREVKKLIIGGLSLTDIANRFDVSIDCIYKIKNLENWSYISEELNEEMINTDTSRKINTLTNKQIDECKKLILDGNSIFNLAKDYKIPYKRFCKIFKEEIDSMNQKNEKIKQKALKMFFDNFTIEQIMKATGLTYAQYKRVTKGQIEKRRMNNILYVGKEVKKGRTNKELARELNVNRCTISVYLKEYSKIR